MKAGLMEIADFFVLNKADRAGADQAVMSIQMILNFRHAAGWHPEVLKAIASEGKGIGEVAGKIDEHRLYLQQGGGLITKRRARLEQRINDLVVHRLRVDFWTPERLQLLAGRIDGVMNFRSTPYDLAEELVQHFSNRS